MPEPQNPAAFISYCREDSEFALRLAQDLKAAGAAVWIDQLDIPAGINWDNAIEDALIAAPSMLLILSPASSRSNNVRNEISFALEQTKIVIPILYRDCTVPLQLQRANRIDFRADYARGLTSLLGSLHVSHPDPGVLRRAAEGDAQRKAAWQAREAEAQRLHNLAAQTTPAPPQPTDPEAAFQRAREEAFLRQKLEAEAREAELRREAQQAQFGAMAAPPRQAAAPSYPAPVAKSRTPVAVVLIAIAAVVAIVVGIMMGLRHSEPTPSPAPIQQPTPTAAPPTPPPAAKPSASRPAATKPATETPTPAARPTVSATPTAPASAPTSIYSPVNPNTFDPNAPAKAGSAADSAAANFDAYINGRSSSTPPSSSGLAGSTWNYTETTHGQQSSGDTWEFLANGTVRETYAITRESAIDARWTQTGATIMVRSNNGGAIYQGRLAGSKMTGTFTYTKTGQTGTWAATRR